MAGWQSTPVVNIFKQCDVENKKDCVLSGEVGLRMDEVIHKKVFRIVGSIPAVNFLKIPKDKPLGLTGRFLYLQVRFAPNAPLFLVHTELQTADGNTCRVSVGNVFKAENLKKKAGCVQLSLPESPEGWVLLSLDLKAAVSAGGAGASPFKALKSIQLCSTITVRGAFSSDERFSLKTLPREMVLSHALDPSQVQQLWSPAEPTDVPEPVHINKPILPKKKPSAPRRQVTPRADTAAAPGSDQAPSGRASNSDVQGTSLSRDISGLSLTSEPSNASSCRSGGTAVTAGLGPASLAAPARVLQPDPYITLQHVNGFTGEYCRMLYNAATDELFLPAGSMVVAMAAGNHPTAAAAADAADGGSDADQQPQQRRRQRFFIGHNAFVSCMALGGQGSLLATGQEGKQPLMRLWDCSSSSSQESSKCLAILCAHASHLAALDVSADGHALVACGADSVARQMIALWDIRDVRATGKAQLLVKHVTSYHVRVLKFSPFEPDHFVSAGRDTIRCYRMRGDEVRGISIKMQAPVNSTGLVLGGAAASVVSGPKVFTDIAFEAASSGLQLQSQHMFVATAAGAVFQVDYGRRALTAVYQLHAAAINSLSIGEGLALTASDDTTLRLWPLDFSSYLLEAQHKAPVTSACLGSPDGLLLVAGCENGSVGQLDVVGRAHTCLLRSHCGAVLDLAVHPARLEYVTTSADGSVRIWDAVTQQQLVEFGKGGYTRDGGGSAAPCGASCAAFNPAADQLAVGFREGLVRLFDVATSELLQERQQHAGAVTQLLFTPDGSRLLSCGADRRVVVYAVHHGCLPLKALTTPPPPAVAAGSPSKKRPSTAAGVSKQSSSSASSCVCAAVSRDGCWIAVGQPAAAGAAGSEDGAALLLLNAQLDAVLQIDTPAVGFKRVEFSPDGTCLWALALMQQPDADSSITSKTDPPADQQDAVSSSVLCFSVASGSLLQQLPRPHGASAVSHFCLDGAGVVLATCGADHLVKLWDVGGGCCTEGLPSCQSFTAHRGAVAGAAFLGDQLLTVGADGNICVWGLTAAHSPMRSDPALPAAAAGAAGEVGQEQQQEQCRQQQQQQLGAPEGCSTLRNWLEPRSSRVPGAVAVGVDGGVAVAQQQPLLVDEGIEPSPLFSEPAFQQQQQQQLLPGAATAPARRVDPLLSCSAVLGLDASRCGVLWLKQAGLLAYPASNTLILFDLATRQQSLLSHHQQRISAVAVSVDGQLVATGSAGTEQAGGYADVAVWDVQQRRLLMLLQQHPVCVEQLAFSPDGAWLASVGSGRVVVWQVTTGRATAVGGVKQGVSGIAWLPHRPLPAFMTCGGDGLLLWSLTPNFLEQRQLDIPDIALAVNAAAAAAAAAAGGTAGSGRHGSTAQCCQITAACTAASGGAGCDIDSLAAPLCAAAGAGEGAADPVWQRQQREAAAVTVFAADSAGGVLQLALGEGRLCGCIKVTTLPAGEWATSLQWSQPAGALAVGTSSGRLLRFTCSSSSCSSRAGVGKGSGVSSGVLAAVTPGQAAAQWWSAAAGSNAAWTASALPSWTQCTLGSSGSSGGCASQQQQEPLQLDGPVVQLCLEPHELCEGVVTAGGSTAWYVSLDSQQKAPLLAGHIGQITALLPVAAGPQDGSLVASLGQDGRLAVWQTAGASSSSGRGTAQVPVAEWACADAPPTAAVFLQERSACVLGHADGRLALLELPTLTGSSRSSGVLPRGQGEVSCRRSGAGVLCWCVVRQPSAVVGLAVHPDQPLVMAASRDGLITTTHTDSGCLVAACRDLTGTTTPLHAFAVNSSPAAAAGATAGTGGASSSCVAAAAWSDRLLVFRAPWQADVAPVLAAYQCPHLRQVSEALVPEAGLQSLVAFIPGSASLLLFTSPCLGHTALLFDYTAGAPLRQLALTAPPASLAVAPAGQLFAFGLSDGCVLLTDAAAEGSVELRAAGGTAVEARGGGAGVGSRAAVQAVAFAAGGSKLLAAVGGIVTVWDA